MDFLGEKRAADLMMKAITAVTAEARVLTPDLGGKARTPEVTDAVIEKVRALAR